MHVWLQDQFHLCYDVSMASLKAILFNETDASKFLLRATSAECISCIAIAVGEEKFMNDATKVRIHIIFYFSGGCFNVLINCLAYFGKRNSFSQHQYCYILTLIGKGVHN
jgi:hypothetical protein